MSKEWIDRLAQDIVTRSRDAAETYGREQHRAGVITQQGTTFFNALVLCLEEDFTIIRARLQGSAVSCDTAVQRLSATEVKLSRSRFPWFEATLKHHDDDLILDFVQGRGVATDPTLIASTARQSAHFSFLVDPQDKLSLVESFGEAQQQFDHPEDLARHILELLFKL